MKRSVQRTPGDIRTGFVTTDDGLQLHWRAVGSGPLMVCNNGVGVSTFFWKYLVDHFRDRYTVVLWDYRAHGRSARGIDPAQADLTVARHAEDLHSILSAVAPDGEPAILVGHSMGCQVSLEYRRLHPARSHAIILMLGTAGRALDTFFDWGHFPKVFGAVHRLAFSIGPRLNDTIRPILESPLAWEFARRFALVDPYYTRREDLVPYMDHLASIDIRVFLETALQLNQHDAWDLLPTLDRPLLVIAAEKDDFTPMWCSQKIVDSTPDAELLVLADGSHAALIEQPETINHRIDRFLRERVSASPPLGVVPLHP